MAEFEFDVRGNLLPYGPIKASIEEIETTLVMPFQNSTRRLLFAEYLRYANELREVLGKPYYQWMNGSFSQNVRMSGDIDIVSFIDHEIYATHEQRINDRFSKWTSRNVYQNIDAYIVKTYPADHKNFLTFQSDEAYWYDWFGRSRRDQYRKRHPKGFIHVDID